MNNLNHWDATEEFSAQQAAALVVGVDPSNPKADLWKSKPMLERMKEGHRVARAFVTQPGPMTPAEFAMQRKHWSWADALVSTRFDLYPSLQKDPWPGDPNRAFELVKRFAGPDGEFEVQTFARAELHRWLSVIGMKSIYQFDRKQPDATSAPSVVAVGASETKEQRQDRRLKLCEDVGLVMPKSYRSRLPDGVGNVAGHEGLTRQALSADVKAALKRRESAIREGGTIHRA